MSGAAGRAIAVGWGVVAGGEIETLAGSGSERSAVEEERSERRSFRTVMLPALLRSLRGGVCRRVTCWGRAGTGVAEVVLLFAGVLVWDPRFMVSRGEEVANWSEWGGVHGVER